MLCLFALLLSLPTAGCGGSGAMVDPGLQLERDSLYAANLALHAQLLTLQDSLQFVDDVESGYYYRDRRALLNRVEKLEYDLSVCGDGGRTLDTFQADDLFEQNTASLSDAGKKRLDPLADRLKGEHAGQIIRVEGHTDSVPLGPSLQARYPTNWELSAARATSVVRYLTEGHGLPVGQIEAVAFGDTRPVARNDTAPGRRLNRRVRIAVVPR